MLNRLISGVVVIVIAAAGLVASPSGAEARSVRPTLAAPASVTAGQHFMVTVKPHHAGRVALQRKAGNGHWHTVAHRKARRAAGVIRFPRVEHASGRVSYRAKVAGRYSAVDRTMVHARSGTGGSGGSGGTPPPLASPTLFLDVSTNADDIFVNDTYTVGVAAAKGDGSPIAGLDVTVQREYPGATTWTTVGTVTTDSAGEAQLTDSSPTRGFVEYRATGGDLKASTEAVIWQNLTMPTSPGNGVSVTSHVGTGCTAGIVGSGDGVDLRLNPQTPATKTSCLIKTGDSITVTWNFGGNGCVPVQYDGFALSGPTSSQVNLGVQIDDVDFSPDPSTVGAGQTSGRLLVDGDPMQQLVVTMTVTNAGTGTGAGGSFSGHLSAPRGTCF